MNRPENIINSTAYNSLENWGINNISSDSIRRQIADIFQIELPNLREMDIDEREIRLGTYNDIISTKLDWSNIQEIKPINYNDFLKTEELSSRMKAFKTFTTITLNDRIKILEKIKVVRKNLYTEIDRLINS